MKVTKHFHSRMSQRALRTDVVELVLSFGEPIGEDRFIMTRRGARSLIEEMDAIKRAAIRVEEAGGLVLVARDQNLITGFRIESFSSSKARQSRSKSRGR